MEEINVAIVDTKQESIKALTMFLNRSKDILVVGTATTKEQALKLSDVYKIDVMLISINVIAEENEGVSFAKQIVTNYSGKTKVIMLIEDNDYEVAKKSFMAGVFCYVLKQDYKSLPNIIRHIYKSNSLIDIMFKEYTDLVKEKLLKTKFMLSDTELMIYLLAKEGNKQSIIIGKLHISESTYKKHVNSILKKIKATSIKKAIEKFEEAFAEDAIEIICNKVT